MKNHIHAIEEENKHYLVIKDVLGSVHKIEVEREEIERYTTGAKVQDAFPNLSADQRELIISGIPGDLYDSIFQED
jgi:hypothetical protein